MQREALRATELAAGGRFFYSDASHMGELSNSPQTAHGFAKQFYDANRELLAANGGNLIATKVIATNNEFLDRDDPQLLDETSGVAAKHNLALVFESPDPQNGWDWYAWYLNVVSLDSCFENIRRYRLATHGPHHWVADSRRVINNQYVWDQHIYPENAAELYPLIYYLATDVQVAEHIAKMLNARQVAAEKIANLLAINRRDAGPLKDQANVGFLPAPWPPSR